MEEKMKKYSAFLLAFSLIIGFAVTASAQPNIKASGQLYIYGAYVDNLYQTKGSATGTTSANAAANAHSNIANRLRMQFEIQIQEGLKLTTRFDALERDWGQQYVVSTTTAPYAGSVENNISFERAFVTFNALYGVWDVGYQQNRSWGTGAFCDFDTDPGIHYRYMTGPWTLAAEWEKRSAYIETKQVLGGLNGYTVNDGEGSFQSSGNARRLANFEGGTDNDHDVYHIYSIYRWATGQAGLLFEMDRDASTGKVLSTGFVQSPAPYGNAAQALLVAAPPTGTAYGTSTSSAGWVSMFYELAPYLQWKDGPFDLKGELRYIWGKTEYDSNAKATTAGLTDVDRSGWSLYLMGKYTMGAFYGGLEFVYITGDDPNTTDKNEAGVPGGGYGWDPLLMYGNFWFHKHHGAMGNPSILAPGTSPANSTTFNWYLVSEFETNEWMLKPFVGWNVMPNLEIVAQYAYLKAVQKPRVNGLSTGTQFVGDTYGQEFDLYANYRIFNNLTYTIGFGYFWTGDYFKGTDSNINVGDNYLFMNALNLTF
jgi:hypothetical protein